ncbi:MAG TPA: hypothetical protein VFP50_18265 [Anaeromyxobacteraceae bacterium]|nr:hypothetical protein [Anaeromyxobacteraceae bacterium]
MTRSKPPPTRDDLVQEVEPQPARDPSPCDEIPDAECDAYPNCEGCPARPEPRLGRRA